MQRTKVLTMLVIVLLIGNISFAWAYISLKIEARNLEAKVTMTQADSKILAFARLFTDKVLGGSKEVSFDDRLQLENSVRDLNDKEIFNSWQVFTKAKNAAETQKDFYNLFQLLLRKIKV